MKKIQIVKVDTWTSQDGGDAHHDVYREMGMYVTERNGRKKIDLFSIPQSKGSNQFFMGDFVGFDVGIYKACSSIVDQCFYGQKVSDFDWTVTACGGCSDVTFEERYGHISGVRFSNGFVARNGSFHAPIQCYETVLNDPDRFAEVLCDGYPERYREDSKDFVIVPLPKHPDGHLMMRFPLHLDGGTHELVLAHSGRLMGLLIGQEMRRFRCSTEDDLKAVYDAEPLKGDDVAFPPFHTSLETAVSFINPARGFPSETAYACYFHREQDQAQARSFLKGLVKSVFTTAPGLDEEIDFINGRHRTVNMAVLGAPFIPIVMEKTRDLEKFKSEYVWSGNVGISRTVLPSPRI